MANYSCADQVTVRRVFTLPTPSNAVEVEKMMTAAIRDARQIYGEQLPDDTLRIETDDEELRIILDLPDKKD